MGLDITAYSHVIPTDDPNSNIEVFAFVGFDRSTRGLHHHDVVDPTGTMIAVQGYATTPLTHTMRFCAGSYSGHHEFRELLAEAMNHTYEDYTTDGIRDPYWPFYELIYFADNQGCIGPDAAHDLAQDFLVHQYTVKYYVRQRLNDIDATNFIYVYDHWMDAAYLARQDGLIQFH